MLAQVTQHWTRAVFPVYSVWEVASNLSVVSASLVPSARLLVGCSERHYPVMRRAKPSTKAECEVGPCPLVTTAACPACPGSPWRRRHANPPPHPTPRMSLARVVDRSRTIGPSFWALARILQREQRTRKQCSPGPRER